MWISIILRGVLTKAKVNPDEVTDYCFVDVDDMEELEKEEGFLHYERVRKALASM